MLSDSQIKSYRDLGYLAVEDVFSPPEIAELRRVTDEFVGRSRGLTANDAVFDLEPGHSRENPRVATIKNTAKQHPVYRAALGQAKMLNLIAQLIGPDIRCYSDKLNLRMGRSGPPPERPVKWTQPWTHFPHTNDDIVIAGVAIDDALMANGCLQVMPGTHRGPIYDHHKDGKFTAAITDPAFRPGKPAPIEVRAGGLALRHIRLMRSNADNHSPNSRRMIFYHLAAGDAWPLMRGDNYWDTYASSFVRGHPTNQPRIAPIPVRLSVNL